MKTSKSIIYFSCFMFMITSVLNGQTKNKEENKFILTFQTGFSFLTPTNPNQTLLTMIQQNVSLGKSELLFRYKFFRHYKLSLSIGKDNFNEEYDIYSGSPENPIYIGTSIRKAENYWLGFYYDYHFLPAKKMNPYLGIGIGLNDDRKLLFVYTGLSVSSVSQISFSAQLRYSKLFKSNNNSWFSKLIGSQIGVDFGISYEF